MKNVSLSLPDLFNTKALGLIDRDKEVLQILYAFLTREHVLLIGQAGTAKSMLAMNAFEAVKDASTFKIHLTKQTTEEYVFGPLDIAELKKGNMVHKTENSILDKDFAFIDEFFDASDVLLRSLLGILNERMWMKGTQQVPAQLHTAILTTNYNRENEITSAVLDRILFKAEVQPLTSKPSRMSAFKHYINHPNFTPQAEITMETIKKMADMVEDPNEIKVTDEILRLYDTVLTEYSKETGKYISQRTANKAIKVIKASALLDGRKEANLMDIEEVKYVFCVTNNPKEEGIFDAVYEKFVGSLEKDAAAEEELDRIDKKFSEMAQDLTTLSNIDYIRVIKDMNEQADILRKMQVSDTKVVNKKAKLLKRMEEMIAKNKEKIFRE